MRHKHVGPLDRACSGCVEEALQIETEFRRQRFWRVMLIMFLIFLAISSMALLSWKIGEKGPHLR